MPNQINRLIGPFSQIIPFSGLPIKGPLKDEDLQLIKDGGVLVQDGKIVSVGAFEALAKEYHGAEVEEITQPAVLLPGLIDCHTHTCFAGTRSQDYALKLQGKTYIEIAREGGGIRRTVANTRLATEEELTLSLSDRINRHLAEGVTTIEVKSGYGLSVEQELKMLTAIQQGANQTKASIISTCLAAHTLPKEFEGRSKEYLELMVIELLPAVKRNGFSNRVDIFIEETAFTLAEAEYYLDAARAMGFALTVHADQFTPGGAALAARMGALSADHLEASGENDIRALACSETVAVVLPGASLGLGIPFAPARKLLDAGCCLAIASDWNPGSAPMGDLLLQAALLSIFEKLNFAETMAGLTFRAAKALGLHDRGTLSVGMRADMIAFPVNDFREILYHQGKLKPFRVWP
jgi:imidazolonepropionase